MATTNRIKVLILGVTGMLGHKVYQVLKDNPALEVYGTVRWKAKSLAGYDFYSTHDTVYLINACNTPLLNEAFVDYGPQVVINCIGLIKQKTDDPISHIQVNALFPHQLYQICRAYGARLIHISTDCIFSGNKGNYNEDDITDATDIYGRTKYLGEITRDGALTIRTCIIGRELETSFSLLEWFISQWGGSVDGYKNAVFSGFPTIVFARILEDIVTNHPELSGLYHISSEPIDKYTLLKAVNDKMDLGINIKEATEPYCDRSLDSARFKAITGFGPEPWPAMIDEMVKDAKQYDKWRAVCV